MKIYEGHKLPDQAGPGRIFVEEEDGNRHLLTEPRRHSPDGFQWGYGGSGPADTAFALLKDVMGEEPEPWLYQKFKFDKVAHLPATWTMTEEDIKQWLEENNSE